MGVGDQASHESVAKVKFKLEVYHGQDSIEVAENLLMGLISE